jgi:hypothetical protein
MNEKALIDSKTDTGITLARPLFLCFKRRPASEALFKAKESEKI